MFYFQPLPRPRKRSALGELFEEEDQALREEAMVMDSSGPSVEERVKKEILEYRSLPGALSEVDPIQWWWHRKGKLPLLSNLAAKYLCVQASSTPSERVFSTAGDTVSVERARLLPEKVNMLVFLKKNTKD